MRRLDICGNVENYESVLPAASNARTQADASSWGKELNGCSKWKFLYVDCFP